MELSLLISGQGLETEVGPEPAALERAQLVRFPL